MTESLPGGLNGLKDLVSQVGIHLIIGIEYVHLMLRRVDDPILQLQAAGVRVLLPYLPWDQNTNPAGQDHVAALVEQVLGLSFSSKLIYVWRFLLLGLMESMATQ